jgi:hypothetical protein
MIKIIFKDSVEEKSGMRVIWSKLDEFLSQVLSLV